MRRWLCVGVLLIATALAGAGAARASILDRLLPWLSGSIQTQGLAIHWGGELTADTVELKDQAGTYATLSGVTLDWSPLQLIHGSIDVSLLAARRATLLRLPESSSSGGSSSKITVKKLQLDRVDVAPAVAGTAAALKIEGSGRRTADQAEATLTAERIGAGASYRLAGSMDAAGIQAQVTVKEAPGGLLAHVAGLPDLGPIDLDASVAGPRDRLAAKVSLVAGPLLANAQGQVNLVADTIALALDASAPAMTPRPDISWQSVALKATVKGGFATPDANGSLTVEGLAAAGAKVQHVALDLAGNRGRLEVRGELDRVLVPGSRPDLLAAAPVMLTADARLDEPDRPVSFTIRHPLITADGSVQTSGAEQARLRLALPQLGPFAAAAGAELQGSLLLALSAARQAGIIQIAAEATLGITGGTAPAPALIGPSAKIAVAGTLAGESVALSRFSLDGQGLTMAASGTLSPQQVDLAWSATLAHLAALDPRLGGSLHGQGRVGGSEQDLTLVADLAGEISAAGEQSGPFTAHLDARGLPHAPQGNVTAEGSLLGSPLQLAVAGERQADGSLEVTIDQAAWKSASAKGSLTLPAGATLPIGSVQLAVQDLSDFTPLLGRPLTGSARAMLDATAARATLTAEAHNAGMPGAASIAEATLKADLTDLATTPTVDGHLVVTGVSAGTLRGSASLDATGPTDRLAVRLAANLPNLDGAAARLSTTGTVDATAKRVSLASLSADWRRQSLRLLSPVTFIVANGVDIQGLRLGLSSAVIQVDGHVGSTLDLTASARDVPASLVSVMSPGVAASGTISAQARLTGSPERPAGTVSAKATGLRLDTATGRGLPAASVTASAVLQGTAAEVNASLTAGTSHLKLTGRTPFTTTGPLALRGDGRIDLALADPLLGPQGGGIAGSVALSVDITGSVARPAGTVRVRASGVRLLTGAGRGLPPASATATATLAGATARIDADISAGRSHLAVAGRAPLSTTGPLDLRATGSIDLAVANPILTASGRRVDGTLTLAAGIAGTATAPRLTGTVNLSNGDVRDYVQGVHLSDVSARMVASGDTLRIDSLTAHAGNGTLGGSGTIGVLAPGMPVNIALRANDATPLAGGVVTATLNADLSIRGEIERQVALGGTIDVRQATIRIPSKLPTSVATIPVRIAGAPPAPPPQPAFAPEIAMDLTVRAPEQVFVRGRGLNAELGGTIRIQGTAKQMLPRGAFHLRRGTFNLVGSTLNFSSGEISFNGGSITDPALHLVATSFSGGTTATLTVGGTARNPKLTLSSVPDMPQDQILAQLLFHTNTGQLSPFQIAAIAAGLAELSGSTSNFPNPLEGVQNALGLDQLGIGSGANGAPTLQAGRYIGRRLYVGAQESTAGGSQGTVQYNLTPGLKLNASVGAGQTTSAIGTTGESNGASVGITYQFQY